MAGTTSLKLPDELKEKVSSLAQGVAQTPHAYMVEAIAERVSRDEKRREFVEAARASIARSAETGVAYARKDVERWFLARLAGKKVRKPKPTKVRRSPR